MTKIKFCDWCHDQIKDQTNNILRVGEAQYHMKCYLENKDFIEESKQYGAEI